jgi:hypothetical protein
VSPKLVVNENYNSRHENVCRPGNMAAEISAGLVIIPLIFIKRLNRKKNCHENGN